MPIPAETLGRNFLLRHVHPDDPPNKTLLQAVDPELGVRIDVFRVYGFEMKRLFQIELDGFFLKTHVAVGSRRKACAPVLGSR